MASIELPSGSNKPLNTQVGGHSGVLATEDGSLLIKPALPLELQFYQTSVRDPGFAPLRRFVPKFYGTLSLQGKVDEGKDLEGGIAVAPVDSPEKDEYNISHPFIKPNIIDIKLGIVLYDETASPDKVERMIKTAKDTTSLETGIRLTGFQVYNNDTGLPVNTPKSYGKSIKPADLPDGIARFFPVASPATTAENSNSGLTRSTLLPILRGIREDVAELKDAFAQVDMRMVGGSVLIVYEADEDKAKEGLKLLEDGAFEEEDDEEDEDESEDEQNKPGPPFVAKLIDFAHTRIVPGEGPDEGVLLGLNTVLRLLDRRIGQIELSD
ncbi:SAICAR synthase-like protein [Pleurotus eryngii]|uniref:Kinase n=1 Tax=Pleurotus eryngii TaxID=5323 RepID=A0A9P5ZYH5_PLEER|nr:SAICAR synthase-like protein [Pleurotus eryngii]